MKSFFPLLIVTIICFSPIFSDAQQKDEDPVAVDDILYFGHPGTFSIDLLANDYDPEGDSIYIYDIDFDEDDNISIVGSIVTVHIDLDDFIIGFDAIRYKIQDTEGNTDRAYLEIYFKKNESAAICIDDSIIVIDQELIEINLVVNDDYNGSEDLKIFHITNSPYYDIELLADSQTIQFQANAYQGPLRFYYWMCEAGGNEYVSNGSVFVFVDKNENAPIAKADSFDIKAGETFYLDVLANDDEGEHLEIDSIYTEDESFSIVESKIKIDVPIYKRGNYQFHYKIIDQNTGLKSMPAKIYLQIEEADATPIAIRDTIVFAHGEGVQEIFPLENDINPLGNPLIVEETGTASILYDADRASGWYHVDYFCKDTISSLRSYEQSIKIKILPPDSIQIEDKYIDYVVGDEIYIDPYEGSNIPDSISVVVRPQIGTFNYESKTYSFNIFEFEDIMHNEWLGVYELNDTLEITFSFKIGTYQYLRVKKYIYINYLPVQYYSYLNVNNVDLRITPIGLKYGDINFPSQTSLQPVNKINPWICDYTNQDNKRVSGNTNLYYGADFINGPMVDQFSSEYGLKYYRTWKISREEIQNHKNQWQQSGYEMPENIQSWPAQKTIYRGNEYEGADFIDANNNGEYDPENGDYPKISGDEAVLYIVNDGRSRSYGEGIPMDSLNLDMYVLTYAFHRPESEYFNNTFFVKYKIINKSDIDYQDFKFGLYTSASINPGDTYSLHDQMFIGCDTIKNTFFSYPGRYKSPLENWPVKPPVSLFTLLNSSLDKFTEVVITDGGYDAWDNLSPKKMYHYMNGTWDTNLLRPHPYWTSNAPVDYVYTADPMEFGADNYLSNPNFFNPRSDAHMVGTTGSHTLLSGESKTFEYAIQFYLDSESGYAESIEDALSNVSDLIQCYENDSVPGGGSFTGLEEVINNSNTKMLVYPNPARTILYVDGVESGVTYSIYTLQGQKIEEARLENEIFIEHLSKGFYLLQIRSLDGKQQWTSKFVKQ